MNKHSYNFFLVLLALFVIGNNLIHPPGNILSWDVFGYYLYLPCKFIYNDLGITNDAVIHGLIAKYQSSSTFYQALQMPEGHYVMKYSMGIAIFMSPFFFVGHILAGILGYEQDGFSLPYQYSIFAGCIVYAVIALLVLSRALRYYFSEKICAIVLTCIVFGTNYIVHVTMYGQNAMSHNFLLFTYALILYFTIRWHQTHFYRHLIPLALICGLAALSRPTEIVCVIIPVLWNMKSINIDSVKQRMIFFWNLRWQTLTFILILFVIGACQFIYWKIYAGKFFYNTYGAGNAGEGLDPLTPHFYNFLFSFRKGWLIYTPVMFFAIAGLYYAWKRKSELFPALLAFFIINLYLIASWSNWWYTQSFSQRPMVSTYPVMAFLLGFTLVSLQESSVKLRWSLGSILVFFILLNIFQSIQFHRGVIHGDRMTASYYFTVFGKMNATDEDRKLLLLDRWFDENGTLQDLSGYEKTVERHMVFEDQKVAGKTVKKIDSALAFSPAIEIPYYHMTRKDHAWIRITAWIYPTEPMSQSKFHLISQFTHKGHAYKYMTYPKNETDIKPNEWNKIQIDYLTPEVRSDEDFLKTYIWLVGKKEIFLHSLVVECYERKE